MKLFKLWVRAHKIKFAMLIACAIGCGAVMATNAGLGFAILAFAYVAWAVIFILDVKKFLCLLMAASLLAVPVARAQEFKPAAPLVIGGIVIIIGAGLGFVGCKIVKRCQKIARGRTNAEPEELNFIVAGESGEYGAAFMWETGYCLAERQAPTLPVRFTLDIYLEHGSNYFNAVCANRGVEFVQTWGGLTEELEAHGLAATSGLHFSRNRQPVSEEQVPIGFNTINHVARIGAGGVLVTVERSTDLRDWEPLMALDVDPQTNWIRVDDATDGGACFYRVTTKEKL